MNDLSKRFLEHCEWLLSLSDEEFDYYFRSHDKVGPSATEAADYAKLEKFILDEEDNG